MNTQSWPECGCKFIAVGEPLDQTDCKVHHGLYPCDMRQCQCDDYKPRSVKNAPTHWPLCTCGHIAQDHNPKSCMESVGDD